MTPPRHTVAARALHWLTALLILAVAGLGLRIAYAAPAEEALKLRLYNLHESLGLSILALTLIRLWHRARHPGPPLPAGLPPAMRWAAHGTHAALYALLLAMPVVGFLATNAWGFPLRWFELFPVPSPIGRHEALAPLLSRLHAAMALALGGLVAMHVGAALWHQFVRRDGLLRRML